MIDNFLELSDNELTHIDRNKHVIRNINETQMYSNDSINSGKLSENVFMFSTAEKAAPRRDERAARPMDREPAGGRVGPGGPAPSSKHGDAPRMGIAEDAPVPIKTLKTAPCNMNQLEG